MLYRDGEPVKCYPASTSRNPPSCVQDSQGTPWGLHEVTECIGGDQPVGMVFRGRRPIGKTYTACSGQERQDNLITSRILRLRGLEPGVNQGPGVDSYERYIYIHGTNHEDRIGTPASGGCVLLRNADMIDLFERVPPGALVWIGPEEALNR